MTIAVSPNQSNVQASLRGFLLDILPAGTECILGQENLVPEPKTKDFVVMSPIRRERLATNIDSYADCAFTASIAAKVMTVTAVKFGAINLGNLLFGVDVPDDTYVTSQVTGSIGGTGTYAVSKSASLSSRTLATGTFSALQPTEVTMQLDVHSDSVARAADMAQRISTLFRDDYAYMFFKRKGYDVVPLHADSPRQVPFINAENQYESRWVIEACLQANQVVINIPQQFAEAISVDFVPVDNIYVP